MATFQSFGLTTSSNPSPGGSYLVQTDRVTTVPDGIYRPGDQITVFGNQYMFHGYESQTSHLIFDRVGSAQFLILFGPGGSGRSHGQSYTPTNPIVTNDPIGLGPNLEFADYGARMSESSDVFESRDQPVQFQRDIYEVGDTVRLAVGPTGSIQQVQAQFLGHDRETGNLIFDPPSNFNGGRQIVVAVNKRGTYDVPQEDILKEAWPREAQFINYGFRQGDNPGDFDLQGTGFISGLDIQPGVYRMGDTLEIWPQGGAGGGEAVEVTFLGYVQRAGGARYPVFETADFRGSGQRAQFIGTDIQNSGTYDLDPDTLVTDMPFATGVASFADYGARVGTGDTLNSQNREVEFDQGIYEVGDDVTLRIITRDSNGVPTVEREVTATFAGLDRETGDPLFSDPELPDGSDFNNGRQIVVASEEQTTYDVPLTDIVDQDWPTPDASGAEFANYGLRRDFNGDFDLQGTGAIFGLEVPDGLHDVGTILTIRPFGGVGDGEPVQVTVVGHVAGAGGRSYPIFQAADFGGSPAQFIGTRETGSGTYTPGTIVTDEPVGVGALSFADYGLRRDTGNDLDVFNSQNREIEFDRSVYEVGDTVQLRVITGRDADGNPTFGSTIQTTFAGVDRETGDPVFDPVGGGRQIVAASERDSNGYDIPLADIVDQDWPVPDASGATFSNYGLRSGLAPDFDLQGSGAIFGLDVTPGVYDVGDPLMIRLFGGDAAGTAGSVDVQVTLVGYVADPDGTNYPIFEAADLNGQGQRQIIGTNEPDTVATYRVPSSDIVTDEPVGIGEIMFVRYGQRIGADLGTDGGFRIQTVGFSFAQGTYNVNDPVTLDFGAVFGTRSATFLGYEGGTGNPVFREGNRIYVGVTEVFPHDTLYTVTPSEFVTDMPYTTCFAPGTLIATPAGERAVETLKPGEEVLTADGNVVPVRFVGFQKVPTLFGPKEFTRPVRILAGALGENTPHTDLVVTKDHGMIVDGVICNAGALINGTSIIEVPTAELGKVATYYHVETEGHVPLLANGAVAESFIDEVDRASFANHGEFVAMYGARVPAMTQMNLPRAMSARQVPPRLRTRLGLPEYDTTVIIPAPAPSGLRGLWQELREWVRSAGRRLGIA